MTHLIFLLFSLTIKAEINVDGGTVYVKVGEATTVQVPSTMVDEYLNFRGFGPIWTSSNKSALSVISGDQYGAKIFANNSMESFQNVELYYVFSTWQGVKLVEYRVTWTVKLKTHIPISKIELNKSELTFTNTGYDSGEQLYATISPNDATNKDLVWESNNEKVAIVNNGYVYPVSEGTAIIFCSAADGNGAFDSCTVNVLKEPTPPISKYHIVAGYYQSFFIDESGNLWACGENRHGQLGDGTLKDKVTLEIVMTNVKSVAAGDSHTLFLKTDGALWTCGSNKSGELGDGTTTDRSTAKKIMDDVVSIAAGGMHSLAVKKDGSLWAFGHNYFGQLGDGSTTNRATPVKIMNDVSFVEAGLAHTLIVKKDGTLWACGDNITGQVGNGTKTDQHTPVKITNDVLDVAAGWQHSLIIKRDGTLWVCGINDNGELGDGSTITRLSPVKVMSNVEAVAAGSYYSLILKKDGSLWACGENDCGQLGDGTRTTRITPIKVFSNVADISSAYHHSLITKSDGSIWACGSNQYGQLCDGTSSDRSLPYRIEMPVTYVKKISLNSNSITLDVSKPHQLTATVTPANATDKSVTWSSSNTSVATVNNSGLVTAKSPGTVTITCKANDGSGVSATCTVTVVILVENITLNNSSVTLEESKTHQLTATVTPSNATDKSVTWSSSNTSVATVSSSGLVTAKTAGTATITCKANDGSGKSASCKVTVESTPTNPDIYITSIQSGNADLTSLTQKDKLSLTAAFMNYGATATVSTRLWVFDQDMQTVVYSNTQTSTFYGNSLTTVSMDYALTDIPAGKYFASILYYDEWERNTWLYNSEYLVDIEIVDPSPINKGDVNEDGKVNGTDLVALTNIILGKNAQKASADVNGDGKVNGTDYVALANIILGKSAASRSLDTDMAVSGTATLQVDPVAIKAGETRELTVSLTNPNDELTLLQFELLLPEGLYINKVDDNPSVSMGSRTSGNSHQLSAYADGQRVRCLLASPGNELISGTEGAVVRLTVTAADDFSGGSLLLADAIGVSPCEQEVMMPSQRYGLTDSATGVTDVKNAEKSSEVYSLTGQRQVKMKRGINVVNGKKIIKK